jgi:Carboxypeptidase regulatory-like domain
VWVLKRHPAVLAVLAALFCAAPGLAQSPRDGRLVVTVVDQTGGVLPGATVTIGGMDDASRKTAIEPVTATLQGVATFTGLRPGRYAVKAEFPGFDPRVDPDVRVRAGENTATLALTLQKLSDTITVGRDKQESASDRQTTFGSALTREQIDALSDDADVLQEQLNNLAGPGAVIRVDSFEGTPLPPKSQIKSIHITRDGFAAENHNAGAFFIDIVTQPGIGPIRGQTFYHIRDGSMTGQSPFVSVKGPERLQEAGFNIGGSLAQQKASFSLRLNGVTSFETPNLNAALPAGTVSRSLSLQTPSKNRFVNALFDYAINKDQTLRLAYTEQQQGSDNLGVGAYDLPERAYSNRFANHSFRVQEVGPIGRRLFLNTRFQINVTDSSQFALFESPTVRVNDAFTSGGAQVSGGRLSRFYDFQSDLDYVRGMHSFRTGLMLQGQSVHADMNANYLGTYTFDSLNAFEAGRPTSYSRRIGDPAIETLNIMTGMYVQDDIRLRKNLTLSPGLRYEVQSHVHDFDNLGPRVGITWAPFKAGRTTFRGSAGIFYDWMSQNTLEQVARVDGLHQQQVNIVSPAYPDPGPITAVLPADRYQLDPSLKLPRNTRFSGGVDQQLSSRVRVNVLYQHWRIDDMWRGLNLNAPVNGVRPNPADANVVDVVPDAQFRAQQVTFGWNIGPPQQAPFNGAGALWDWTRIGLSGNYTYTHARDDTDGDFSVPPGSLANEWGRAARDIPDRWNVNVNLMMLRNMSTYVYWNLQSGNVYTVRTGLDDNGDLIFNDRPAGVERNTLRGGPQAGLGGQVAYTIPIRKRIGTLPPGIQISNNNGNLTVNQFAGDQARFRVTFIMQAQNLTNHANYTGYSGVLTSPFFGQATAVNNPRRIDLGVQFNF